MARTYKRDNRGRFASGSGGGSTGKPAAGKTAAKKPAAGKAAASKPASNGRRGPRGGKVGTKAQQAKAKREQQARSKQFASKKQATSAQKAWKAASRGARMSEKGAAKKVAGASKVKASSPSSALASKVVARGARRKASMARSARIIAPRISDQRNFDSFAKAAKIPTMSINWGRQRGQGKRLGGGMIRGAMAAVPIGVKKYLDYSRAKGVTKKVWEELRLFPDEHKRAAIGAIQRGWSARRALDLGYRMM